MKTSVNEAPLSEARKLYNCLQGLHFLHRLKMTELEQLLAVMRKKTVPAEAWVYRQGDRADAFYLVSSGRLAVWHKSLFKAEKRAVLEPGQFFGENSLLSHNAHHGSGVQAETRCELYVLHKEDFERILMANEEIAVKIRAHAAEIKAAPAH